MSGASFSVNKLGGLASVLKNVEENSVAEAARVAEDYAKEHVQVLTGQTQESIRTETDGNTISLVVDGASLFLEYGTVHMRAFPFMRPAMDAAEAEIGPDHLKTALEGEV